MHQRTIHEAYTMSALPLKGDIYGPSRISALGQRGHPDGACAKTPSHELEWVFACHHSKVAVTGDVNCSCTPWII